MPKITDPLVLPDDVSLLPVSKLSQDLRERLDCEEGDVAITRSRSRTPSKVINASAADLLREFRLPTTIS